MPHRAGHGKSRRWWLYPITFKCLPLSLIDCHGKTILIVNRVLHSLKGTVGRGVHNRILRVRIACLELELELPLLCSAHASFLRPCAATTGGRREGNN